MRALGLVILFSLLLFSGCNPPPKNPEKKDKVYNAIRQEIEELDGRHKKGGAELRRANRELKKLSPHDGEYSFLKEQMMLKRRSQDGLMQKIRFLELQKEQRVKLVRKLALDAWKNGETIDPNKGFDQYLKKRQYKQASKDWRERVPKMYDDTAELKDELKEQAEKKEADFKKTVEENTP